MFTDSAHKNRDVPEFQSEQGEDALSLLSYMELVELVDAGVLTNVTPEQINSSSIDLTLGPTILKEKHTVKGDRNHVYVLSLRNRDSLPTKEIRISYDHPYVLAPGEFILAHSQQVFHLPSDISAEYKLKSSMARIGLEHLNAGWADAGWNGSVLTLELKNMTRRHAVELSPGDRIGQIVFFRHTAVPEDKHYGVRGRYNKDTTVSGCKK